MVDSPAQNGLQLGSSKPPPSPRRDHGVQGKPKTYRSMLCLGICTSSASIVVVQTVASAPLPLICRFRISAMRCLGWWFFSRKCRQQGLRSHAANGATVIECFGNTSVILLQRALRAKSSDPIPASLSESV